MLLAAEMKEVRVFLNFHTHPQTQTSANMIHDFLLNLGAVPAALVRF